MSAARFQMAVETPVERVCLIRVAGNLDRSAAAGLLRLIDAQMALVAAGRRRVSDLVVDLEGVGSFEPGGLEAVRHAQHSTAVHGVRIHLAGCSCRFHLLPLRACQILREFSMFPTVEVALAELARTTTPAATTPTVTTPTVTTPTATATTPTTTSSTAGAPAPADREGGGARVLPAPRRSPERTRSAARPSRADVASTP